MVPRLTYPVGNHCNTNLEHSLELLETHPIFTGRCPDCGYEFDADELPVHFDCPECGWIDDSI